MLTDQQRRDSLGCYGNRFAATPHIDRLAAESVQFSRCYVANPVCMPNRHTLFTGCYPHNHGVHTNGILADDSGNNLLHHLSALGWQTANIGKIHFTPTDSTTPPGQSPESVKTWADERADYDFHGPYWGFDYLELTVGHAREKGHYRQWFLQNGGTDELFKTIDDPTDSGTGCTSLPESLHVSTFVGERTCSWLRELRDPQRPFFLVASFPDPHQPLNPPAETAARFTADCVQMPVGDPDDLQTRPTHYRRQFTGEWNRMGDVKEASHPQGFTEEQTRERLRLSNAMVSLIDQNVGHILETLRELGLSDDTLVLFTSDHGELHGDHGLWLKGPFFYEGLLNVPLLIHVPGTGARKQDTLFSTVDFVPTLCELVGVSTPDYVDGVSQARQVLHGGAGARSACMVEYCNGYGAADIPARALVTERYKYVHYANGESELTDLVQDPLERRNVAQEPEYQAVRSELQERLLNEILRSESKLSKQISFA